MQQHPMRSLFGISLLLLAPLGGLASPPNPCPDDHGRAHTRTASYRPGGFQGQRGPSPEERESARRAIGITAQQQDEIEKLFKRSDPFRQKLRDLSKQLFDVYAEYDFDRAKAASLRKEMRHVQYQLSAIQADNEEQLRKILTREQFTKMRAYMKQQFDQMRQRRGHRPGGPPPP